MKKLFWDAGLKELAELFHHGSTLTSLEGSHDFRKNHDFLLEIWEAMYRLQVEQFFQWRSSQDMQCKETKETIESEVIDLLQELRKSKEKSYTDMASFLQKI